jgi:hypothetical protein
MFAIQEEPDTSSHTLKPQTYSDKMKRRIEQEAGKKYEDMESWERWGGAAKNLSTGVKLPCSRSMKERGECD